MLVVVSPIVVVAIVVVVASLALLLALLVVIASVSVVVFLLTQLLLLEVVDHVVRQLDELDLHPAHVHALRGVLGPVRSSAHSVHNGHVHPEVHVFQPALHCGTRLLFNKHVRPLRRIEEIQR